VSAATGSAGGEVVLITGASSGIGLSTARAFAARGAHLVLCARSESRLAAVAELCSSEGAASVAVRPADVGDSAQVRELVERTADEHGRLDVVVHAATVMAYGSIEALPEQVFEAVVHTAINGTFLLARAALEVFRRQRRGTLVVVNSLLGSIAAPEMGAYVTAKWGQAGLLRVLQLETRDEPGIHVCSVSPGGVNTPIYSQAANVTGRTAQPPPPIDSPEKVAAAIVGCVDRPRNRISVGLINPIAVLGFRLFPVVYDALVTPLLHLASLSARPATQASNGNVLAPVPEGESEHGRWPGKFQLPRR
jgi:NAD(P)-dependent dehydrogenase (short-subunit alcohol dehydrogenase family)